LQAERSRYPGNEPSQQFVQKLARREFRPEKRYAIPHLWESQAKIAFRQFARIFWSDQLGIAWNVFNITNSVGFDTNSIDNGSDDGGFGLYSGTLTNPRVQQFSLRVTF
jgi:hypothetical protein